MFKGLEALSGFIVYNLNNINTAILKVNRASNLMVDCRWYKQK